MTSAVCHVAAATRDAAPRRLASASDAQGAAAGGDPAAAVSGGVVEIRGEGGCHHGAGDCRLDGEGCRGAAG
jgi:hypothetical protein